MKRKKSIRSRARLLGLAGITIALITSALIGWTYYKRIFFPNTDLSITEERYLKIRTGTSFSDLIELMEKEELVVDLEAFRWTALKMKYDRRVIPGRYRIQPGMSNKELISRLRSGDQEPVQVLIPVCRNVQALAGLVSRSIEADSIEILRAFQSDSLWKESGLKKEERICMVIPNTYEFWWNTDARGFLKRVQKEYAEYWTRNRTEKAEKAGLSPVQVSILASIVEQESQKPDERDRIAGVYLNRLRKNWKLEADPTLIFALNDFSIRRVLNEHKEVNSPYNTYKYFGLPPGPICIPSPNSIESVLNYEEHSFMFFCAREDFSGYHNFASSYSEHLLNARKFQSELNRRGIRS